MPSRIFERELSASFAKPLNILGSLFVVIVYVHVGVYRMPVVECRRHPVTQTGGPRETRADVQDRRQRTPGPHTHRRHAGKALLCSQAEPRASPYVFWREVRCPSPDPQSATS